MRIRARGREREEGLSHLWLPVVLLGLPVVLWRWLVVLWLPVVLDHRKERSQ